MNLILKCYPTDFQFLYHVLRGLKLHSIILNPLLRLQMHLVSMVILCCTLDKVSPLNVVIMQMIPELSLCNIKLCRPVQFHDVPFVLYKFILSFCSKLKYIKLYRKANWNGTATASTEWLQSSFPAVPANLMTISFFKNQAA